MTSKLINIVAVILIFRTTFIDTICEIPISSNNVYRVINWPLVFNPHGDLLSTIIDKEQNVEKIMVKDEEVVLFSCAPNYFKNMYRKNAISAKCNGVSGNFSIPPNSEDSDLTTFSCDLRVIEEIQSPVFGCSGQMTSSIFGYVHPKEELAKILGEVCYNMDEGKTIFAHVRLGNKDFSYLKNSTAKSVSSGVHVSSEYKLDLFRGLFFHEIYDRIRHELQIKNIPNLKLTNYIDDVLLDSTQYQAVKKQGWNYFVTHDELQELNYIKQDIRKLSNNLNIDIYIGSHGIREFYAENDKHMVMFLREKRFPMPNIIWILVHHNAKAMAFAIRNIPSVDNNVESFYKLPEIGDICLSICDKVSWLHNTLKSSSILCCSYSDMKTKISEMPNLDGITEMLL